MAALSLRMLAMCSLFCVLQMGGLHPAVAETTLSVTPLSIEKTRYNGDDGRYGEVVLGTAVSLRHDATLDEISSAGIEVEVEISGSPRSGDNVATELDYSVLADFTQDHGRYDYYVSAEFGQSHDIDLRERSGRYAELIAGVSRVIGDPEESDTSAYVEMMHYRDLEDFEYYSNSLTLGLSHYVQISDERSLLVQPEIWADPANPSDDWGYGVTASTDWDLTDSTSVSIEVELSRSHEEYETLTELTLTPSFEITTEF